MSAQHAALLVRDLAARHRALCLQVDAARKLLDQAHEHVQRRGDWALSAAIGDWRGKHETSLQRDDERTAARYYARKRRDKGATQKKPEGKQ